MDPSKPTRQVPSRYSETPTNTADQPRSVEDAALQATREFTDDTPSRFYADVAEGGQGATEAYVERMGYFWHHGRPEHEPRGQHGLSSWELAQSVATAMATEVVTALRIGPGDVAVDFGSGPGGTTLFMALASGARFVGLSNAEAPNRAARALAAANNAAGQVEFLTIGSSEYRILDRFTDTSFDAATWFESACHLLDRPALFRSLYRILKPGSMLIGVDWIQRTWGDLTPEEIARDVDAVCRYISLASLGTIDSYASDMTDAGFQVEHAEDLFAGQLCWGSTPLEDRQHWLDYAGTDLDVFARGKNALDLLRAKGVFSVGYWIARKPGPRRSQRDPVIPPQIVIPADPASTDSSPNPV